MTLPLTPDDVRAIVREELRAHEKGQARALLSVLDSTRQNVKGLPDRIEIDLPHGDARELHGVEVDGAPRSAGSLTDSGDVVGQAHIDSSSVVPGVAPSGDDATVEAPGDTARPDSPRRVAGTRSPENVARSRARAAAIRELVAAGDLERDWLDVAADIEAEAATA